MDCHERCRGGNGGVTAVAEHGDELDVKSVSINNIGGFTGNYWQNLQGSADISVVRPAYTITGAAMGFTSGNPSPRTLRASR
jgi:ipoprotein LpqH